MNTPQLPPLPKPDTHCFDEDTGKDVWSHSPAQTQAYAIAAIEAQASAVQQEPRHVAYLGIGAGGYVDLGSDLTTDELQGLPKGRHMLVIAGTFGIDGYVPANPAQQPKPQPLSNEQKDAVLSDVVDMLSKQHDWLTRTSAINLVAGLYGRAGSVLAHSIFAEPVQAIKE